MSSAQMKQLAQLNKDDAEHATREPLLFGVMLMGDLNFMAEVDKRCYADGNVRDDADNFQQLRAGDK
eukprot:1962771-Karenia_brevis.AAC.1